MRRRGGQNEWMNWTNIEIRMSSALLSFTSDPIRSISRSSDRDRSDKNLSRQKQIHQIFFIWYCYSNHFVYFNDHNLFIKVLPVFFSHIARRKCAKISRRAESILDIYLTSRRNVHQGISFESNSSCIHYFSATLLFLDEFNLLRRMNDMNIHLIRIKRNSRMKKKTSIFRHHWRSNRNSFP